MAWTDLQNQQPAQVQKLDQVQTQIALLIGTQLLPLLQEEQAIWNNIGPVLGIVGPDNPCTRNLPGTASPFANATLTIGDYTNNANFYSTLAAAINNQANLGYLANLIGLNLVGLQAAL